MCGIVGCWDNTKQLTLSTLKLMTDSMQHRGPDAEGFFHEDNIFLGHRRLSIIDLSNSANQPMTSSCGRYTIVYNGEVYNFKTLKETISQQNPQYQWKTTSDTEVVLAAFIHYGYEFTKHLNGMFAIAIYDKCEKILYLYRDRVGVKPLYYYHQDGLFAFASEIKSLLQVTQIKDNLTIDKSAIEQYLHLGYIPHPQTIYNEIHKFPQSAMARFDGNVLKIESYWDLPRQITESITDETTAKKQLQLLLEDSIAGCMISDVPFGTFLSGGIDSSIVTAVAQHLSLVPINTFSIGFEDVHNEAQYAKSVAEHLHTSHHELYLKEKDAIALAEGFLSVYDEPYADSSAIPSLLVSQMAAKDVKMVLSGDGGDELFLGYGAYTWAKRMNNPILHLLRKPMSYVLNRGNNRTKRVAALLNYSGQYLKSHIFSQEQYLFSQEEIEHIMQNSTFSTNVRENYASDKQFSVEEQQALFDFNYYLPDDLLVKVDRAAMKYALEVRVPLLDHRIVELAFSLDVNLKKKGDISKYLLKEVLYDYLPQPLFDRPKWGFSIPLQRWLQKDLHYLIDKYLSEEIIEKLNLFNYNQIKLLIYRFDNGETYLYNRIWVLIVFVKFMTELYEN